MTKNQYQGKRITITFPPELYGQILESSKDEGRTFSQQVVRLCSEAFKTRKKEN